MTSSAEATWHERHASGLEMVAAMLGGTEPETHYQQAVATRGAVAAWGIDYVFGELWTRPGLTRRDRSMVLIALLGALGRNPELEVHVGAAIRNGMTAPEIEDVFQILLVYAGFPATLNAQRVAQPVLAALGHEQPPRAHELKGTEDRAEDAAQAAATIFGIDSPRVALVEQYGTVGEFMFDFALGEVWSSHGLGPRDRLLVATGILAALGTPRLLTDVAVAARGHGVTDAELGEVLMMVCAYGGLGRAVEASAVLGLPGRGQKSVR